MYVFEALDERVALPTEEPKQPYDFSDVDWSQFDFSEIPTWTQYINPDTGEVDKRPFIRFRNDYWEWFEPIYNELVRVAGEASANHWRSWTCGEIWTIWRRHLQYGDSASLAGVFTEVSNLLGTYGEGGDFYTALQEHLGVRPVVLFSTRYLEGLMVDAMDKYFDEVFYVEEDPTSPGYDFKPVEEPVVPMYDRLLLAVAARFNIELTASDEAAGLTLEQKVKNDIAAATAWATLKTLYINVMTADKTQIPTAVVDAIMALKERGEDWIYEVFAEEFATEDDYSFWTDTIMPEIEKREEEIATVEAMTAAEEAARLGAAYKILGRPLSKEEETYLKNFEQMADHDIALFPELARVYWFTGGLSTYGDAIMEAEDYRAYMQFMNSAVPQAIKEQFADFNTLYDDYKRFSLLAFARAQASENYVNAGEIDDPEDVVAYNTWTFSEWVNFRAAYVAIQTNTMLGKPSDAEWTTLQRLLEEQDISGYGAAFLVQQPGESYAEYMLRLGDQFGPEVVDMLSMIGAVTPSPLQLIEDIAPEVRIAVREAFIGYVEPENRMQFMNELQANLPILWTQFSQLAGPLQPSSEAYIAQSQIRNYQQEFIKWLKDQDFRGGVSLGGVYAGFSSLMKQEQGLTARQRFMPTRQQVPKEFGLGM